MTATIKVGDVFNTNEGYIVTVVKYVNCSIVYAKFADSNIVIVNANNLRNGSIRNRNHTSMFGVGYIGYGEYNHTNNKKAHQVWVSMLARCYDLKTQLTQNPTYIGCSVDETWHNFQEFAKWFYVNYIEGFHLDKDLIIKNNNIYSPLNCLFLPEEINIALRTNYNKESKLPVGVCERGKKYVSFCRVENYGRLSETSKTIEEAFFWYKKTKESYIKRLAETFKEILPTKTYKALLIWKV